MAATGLDIKMECEMKETKQLFFFYAFVFELSLVY